MTMRHRLSVPIRDDVTGIGFIGNAVRQALIFNAYEGKTVFSAVVLTTPVIMSELDLDYNGPTAAAGGDRVSEFMFKGRIIGEEGIPSPHDYIPDPCNIEASVDTGAGAQYIMNLIALHTTFFSATQQETQTGVKKPKVGDIVRVELERNVFSYNLANGTFLEIATDSAITARTVTGEGGVVELATDANDRSECQGLNELFEHFNNTCNRASLTSGTCWQGFFEGTGLSAAGSSSQFFPYILTNSGDADKLCAPTAGVMTSPYGPRVHPIHQDIRNHAGLDIATSGHPDIVSIAAGRVVTARFDGNDPGPTTGAGNLVRIMHDVDDAPERLHSSRYLHMHTVDVTVGQTVTLGQKIGTMGTTGGSTGDHLHFEAKYDSGTLGDPVQMFGWNPCIFTGVRSGTMTPGQKCPARAGTEMGGLVGGLADVYHRISDEAITSDYEAD